MIVGTSEANVHSPPLIAAKAADLDCLKTVGRLYLAKRCDRRPGKAMKGGKLMSAESVLKDIALPVGNLCIAPRFCSAFRNRDTRNVINARDKSADEISSR